MPLLSQHGAPTPVLPKPARVCAPFSLNTKGKWTLSSASFELRQRHDVSLVAAAPASQPVTNQSQMVFAQSYFGVQRDNTKTHAERATCERHGQHPACAKVGCQLST